MPDLISCPACGKNRPVVCLCRGKGTKTSARLFGKIDALIGGFDAGLVSGHALKAALEQIPDAPQDTLAVPSTGFDGLDKELWGRRRKAPDVDVFDAYTGKLIPPEQRITPPRDSEGNAGPAPSWSALTKAPKFLSKLQGIVLHSTALDPERHKSWVDSFAFGMKRDPMAGLSALVAGVSDKPIDNDLLMPKEFDMDYPPPLPKGP